MQASKSLSKRKREDMEAAKADREAKALKREMRRKGHVVSCWLLCLRLLFTDHMHPSAGATCKIIVV